MSNGRALRSKTNYEHKFILALFLVGMIPLSAIGILALNRSSTALRSLAFNQLTGLREVKKNQLARYFETLENQAAEMARGSRQANQSAGELSKLAERLQTMVSRFRI